MTTLRCERTEPSAADPSLTKRRSLILGVGVAGAAAIVAKTLPVAPEQPMPAAAAPPTADPDGYRLTQHVLRYYETTKV